MKLHSLLSPAATLYLLLLLSATNSSAGTSTPVETAFEGRFEKFAASINKPEQETQATLSNTSDHSQEHLSEYLDPSFLGQDCQEKDQKLSCIVQGINLQASPSSKHTEWDQFPGLHEHVHMRKIRSQGKKSQNLSKHEKRNQSQDLTSSGNETTNQMLALPSSVMETTNQMLDLPSSVNGATNQMLALPSSVNETTNQIFALPSSVNKTTNQMLALPSSANETTTQVLALTSSVIGPTNHVLALSSAHSERDAEDELPSPTTAENNQAEAVSPKENGDLGVVGTRVLITYPVNENIQIFTPPVTSNRDSDKISNEVHNVDTQTPAAAFSTHRVDAKRGRLLVAVARTLIISTASTSTTSVLATCFNTPATPPLCRKKKRAYLREGMILADIHDGGGVLDSSLAQDSTSDQLRGRLGRLILWSSQTTTVVFTSTTTVLPTISVSISCTFAGIPLCPG